MLGIVETLSTAKIISSEMCQDHSLFGKNIFKQNTLNPCLSKFYFFIQFFIPKRFVESIGISKKKKSKTANLPSVYFA